MSMMTSECRGELVACHVVRIVTGTKLTLRKQLMDEWVRERFKKEGNHQGLSGQARVWKEAVFVWTGTRDGTVRGTLG